MRFIPVLLFALFFSSADSADHHVYFGTYTRGSASEGIYRSDFDSETGELSDPVLVAEMENPSFLAIHPERNTLYAASEVADVNGGGEVLAFLISEDGLNLIDRRSSGGAGPCHLSMTSDGAVLGVANYGGGSVASFRTADPFTFAPAVSVIEHTGSSIHPKRQQSPKAHSFNFSPDGQFAYAADLGADRIFIYRVEPETAALTLAGEVKMTPGDGPRHFTFHPSGAYAYVINEMTLTVTAFAVNRESGALEAIQNLSTLPDGAEVKGSTAEIICHPNGKFLYGSNRGDDSIAVFRIAEETGMLTRVENEPIQGKTPRNFALDPSGKWLLAAGQNSNTVAVFSVNQETGELDYTGNSIKVVKPVCVRFLPITRRCSKDGSASE